MKNKKKRTLMRAQNAIAPGEKLRRIKLKNGEWRGCLAILRFFEGDGPAPWASQGSGAHHNPLHPDHRLGPHLLATGSLEWRHWVQDVQVRRGGGHGPAAGGRWALHHGTPIPDLFSPLLAVFARFTTFSPSSLSAAIGRLFIRVYLLFPAF